MAGKSTPLRRAVHGPALSRVVAPGERCPIALYVAGNVDILNDPQLAIVGSRNPTPQGKETAEELSEYLAARGLVITSGLAVLGSGVDVIYPRSNRALSVEIMQQGALVSGFPLEAPSRREHFPRRNGIIVALSLGTLVVDAARRSGSLITARLASGLGRELIAVPGSIYSPLSGGCHELIRQGAKLTETAHDILSELNFSVFLPRSPAPPWTFPRWPAMNWAWTRITKSC